MRPHVHANCAMTLDGFVGGPGRTPLKISNEVDLVRVHELRASHDAILVGVGTVLADDPKLTVKWELLGRQGGEPLRVVLDPGFRTPEKALVRDKRARSLFFVRESVQVPPEVEVERLATPHGAFEPGAVLDRLGRRGVRRLLIEGGPRTLRVFLEGQHVDRFTLFVAGRVLGAEGAPRLLDRPLDLARSMRVDSAAPLGDGVLVSWRRA